MLLSAPERRFACENKELLTDWLRDDLGFEGYVMSDRGATHSTAPAIKAGLDLEFGVQPNTCGIWATTPSPTLQVPKRRGQTHALAFTA